jgi:hypothetical protein
MRVLDIRIVKVVIGFLAIIIQTGAPFSWICRQMELHEKGEGGGRLMAYAVDIWVLDVRGRIW